MSLALRSVVALGMAYAPPQGAPIQDHANPVERTVETSYACLGGDRRITLVYDARGQAALTAMVRRGVALPSAELQRAQNAIGRLDGVMAITPQCSESSDLLIVVGVVGRQRSAVFLHWSDAGIAATEPEPIGF